MFCHKVSCPHMFPLQSYLVVLSQGVVNTYVPTLTLPSYEPSSTLFRHYNAIPPPICPAEPRLDLRLHARTTPSAKRFPSGLLVRLLKMHQCGPMLSATRCFPLRKKRPFWRSGVTRYFLSMTVFMYSKSRYRT